MLSCKTQLRQWDSWALHAANARELAELRRAWRSAEFFEVVASYLDRTSKRWRSESKL